LQPLFALRDTVAALSEEHANVVLGSLAMISGVSFVSDRLDVSARFELRSTPSGGVAAVGEDVAHRRPASPPASARRASAPDRDVHNDCLAPAPLMASHGA